MAGNRGIQAFSFLAWHLTGRESAQVDSTIDPCPQEGGVRLVLLARSLVITVMTADDQQLISRLKIGDEQAMAQLLERHWTGLVRYSYGLLGDWDGAEDVTQGAYVRLWANRDRWTAESSAALLYRITRNAVLDVLKSRSHAARADVLGTLAASDTPERDIEGATQRLPRRVQSLQPPESALIRLQGGSAWGNGDTQHRGDSTVPSSLVRFHMGVLNTVD